VFARLHGGEADGRMPVVGRADLHGVEPLAELGKHLAPVAKGGRLGKFVSALRQTGAVHIAKADELHLGVGADAVEVR
jgi:hypothetical protein